MVGFPDIMGETGKCLTISREWYVPSHPQAPNDGHILYATWKGETGIGIFEERSLRFPSQTTRFVSAVRSQIIAGTVLLRVKVATPLLHGELTDRTGSTGTLAGTAP
jgi:hypothetical protein